MRYWAGLLALAFVVAVGAVTYVAFPDDYEATPLQSNDVGLPSKPVTWNDAPLPKAGSYEMLSPFGDFVRQQAPDADDRWTAYLIRDGGAPEMLSESRRWLMSADWSENGREVSFDYYTDFERRVNSETFLVRGRSTVDIVHMNQIADFNAPTAFVGDPASGQYLLTRAEERSTNSEAFIVDAANMAHRLDGLGAAVQGYEWSADGRYISVIAFDPAPPVPPIAGQQPIYDVVTYFLEPGGSVAHEAGRSLQPTYPAWSPDGRQLAVALSARGVDGDDIAIVTVATGDRRIIHVPVPLSNVLHWTVEGIDSGEALIDPATGAVIAQRSYVDSTLTSPDGRFVLTTRETNDDPQDCRLYPPQETVMLDNRTSEERIVLGCSTEDYAPVRWLSNTTALVSYFSCCHGTLSAHAIIELPQGRVAPLTSGTELGSQASVSKQGNVLVSGDSLRLYDASGALICEITPAPGRRISVVSWSPDGTDLVYVEGPPVSPPL